MEGKAKCKFYQDGSHNSCKNGIKCPFQHGQKPKNKVKQEVVDKEDYEGYQIREEESQKVTYLKGMIGSLRSVCLHCKNRKYLGLAQCGCQVMCNLCLSSQKKCSKCGKKVDQFIGFR